MISRLIAAGSFNVSGILANPTLHSILPLVIGFGGIYYFGKRSWGTTLIIVICTLVAASTSIGSSITGDLSQVTGGLL